MEKRSGDFYTQLAFWYDEIFPVSVQQVDFVHRIIERQKQGRAKRLLDVGCGTGALALTLSILGIKVVGVDLSRNMIEQARLKSEAVGSTPEFYKLDMLALEDNLAGMQFDLITCLGNTLVHLQGPEEILRALKQFTRLLDPDGALVLQILNYDAVFEQGITELPNIEGEEGLLFERRYRWHEGDQSIIFSTRLTTPENSKPIEQETSLYPLRKDELEEMLKSLGYENQSWYSSFQRDPVRGDQLPLIVHARR